MKLNKKTLMAAMAVIVAVIFFAIVLNYDRIFAPKKQWGAYTGNTALGFEQFAQMVGQKPDINAIFVGWNDPFRSDVASVLKPNGQTLLIFWEQYGVTLDEIIAGNSDSYIQQFAMQAKAYGGPVIISPLHEMNGNWSPWNGTVGNNTPQKVILAYRHIYEQFSGVQNVKWAWVVNNESVPDTPANSIASYYPGNEYVDYVGIDGFNFGSPWQTYSEIFSEALKQVAGYGKPILITSMASAQGAQKPAWIKDAILNIRKDPSIKGWVWFNENKEQNWLVNSDADSLNAFKQAIK